jgi:hypothetical protein
MGVYTRGMDENLSNWRKSSFSHANGNCIEVAASRGGARWVKSSLSFSNGQCAEVAAWQGSVGPAVVVGVRDTKDRGAGPVLTFSAGAWEVFTAAVKRDAR